MNPPDPKPVVRKKTIHDFVEMKRCGKKVAWLTSYTYAEGYCAEQAEIDLILVGDSGNMTTLGNPSTHSATMEDMISMTKAVRRGAPNTHIVFDFPFGSYEVCSDRAVENAIRAVKEAGADSVKLEGASSASLSAIKAISDIGIPVFGHLGLTPQSAASYKVQGNTKDNLIKIAYDETSLEVAGASIILLEAMPAISAKYICDQAKVPIYGIGAGSNLDGQLLIISDLLGYYPNFKPKFAKNFVEGLDAVLSGAYSTQPIVGDGFIGLATRAIKEYVYQVKYGYFPDQDYTYKASAEIIEFLSKNGQA